MTHAKIGLSGLCLLLATGCTHIRTVEGPDNEYLQSINRQTRNETVMVFFGDQQQALVNRLEMGAHTTTWISTKTGRMQSVDTKSIREVRVVDRVSGLIDGLGIGVALGASLGTMTGASGEMADYETRGSKAAVGGFIGGILMGGFGMIVGTTKGAKQCYRFRWDSDAQRNTAARVKRRVMTY